ncbi:MAG: ABC transporter ATP-binding protein [Peptostreptococcales bacterium]
MNILELKNIGISFGGLKAVHNVNFKIGEHELLGLIGPNGAGKTTLFNLLTGIYRPTEGSILFDGQSIIGLKPSQIVKLGAARTFQNIRLFKGLTVLENVKTAFFHRMSYNTFSAIIRTKKFREEEIAIEEKAIALLKIFRMESMIHQDADNLPYGMQRKLEIARALATNPKLLLLDEPAAGMNPQETKELMETILMVKDHFNIAILLIEHDMNLVMGICERIVVVDYGQVIATGTPEEIKTNKRVIGAYLGE